MASTLPVFTERATLSCIRREPMRQDRSIDTTIFPGGAPVETPKSRSSGEFPGTISGYFWERLHAISGRHAVATAAAVA
jgi:hypothetical protein